MRIESYEGDSEKNAVTALITSEAVLARISPQWDGKLFSSDEANYIAKLCVAYYRRFGKAPQANIQTLVSNRLENNRIDSRQVRLIEKLLESLSDRYERSEDQNDDLLIDNTAKHIRAVRIRRTAEEALAALNSGELEQAHAKLESYETINTTSATGIDLFTDDEPIRSLFRRDSGESIIEYPGALGKFFGRSLSRGAFVNFIAAEKTGKSYWLMDMAYRAALQRRKVAFFGVGDMTEDEMLERFIVRACCRPKKSGSYRYPKEIKRVKEDHPPKVTYTTRDHGDDLSEEEAINAARFVQSRKIRSRNPYCRIYFHPSGTCSVQMISDELSSLERRGFYTDVCVIDYADILAMPAGVRDRRDQINENWSQLRALSQAHRVLLLTATQAPARSYGKERIGKGDFTDDKRKRSHVTGEISLTIPDDSRDQVYRLGWTVRRAERADTGRILYVAECRAIANPAVLSTF